QREEHFLHDVLRDRRRPRHREREPVHVRSATAVERRECARVTRRDGADQRCFRRLLAAHGSMLRACPSDIRTTAAEGSRATADPDAIETRAVDWIFADGTRLEGYSFVDVVRRLDAYDYARTAIIVEMETGRRFIAGLARPRALKRDIDPAINAF